VFRYTPSPVEATPAVSDDETEVADWFETATDPAIAQAVAKAEADARDTSSITPAIEPPVIHYSVETQQPIGYEPAQPPPRGAHRADEGGGP